MQLVRRREHPVVEVLPARDRSARTMMPPMTNGATGGSGRAAETPFICRVGGGADAAAGGVGKRGVGSLS